MLGKTTNPLLQKTEQQVQAKVDPALQNAFQRIVTAGLKVMYSQKSHDMMVSELKAHGDPAEIAGNGVAKLLGLLMSQSKGTMPMKAGIPAGTVLLCEGLDFMEQAGLVKVDQNVLAKAMQAMSSSFLQLLGVTPDKMGQMIAQARQQQAAPKAAPPKRPAGIVAAAQQGAPA